jgi:hypothetical protein
MLRSRPFRLGVKRENEKKCLNLAPLLCTMMMMMMMTSKNDDEGFHVRVVIFLHTNL